MTVNNLRKVLFLAGCMIAAMITACGGNGTGSDSEGVFSSDTDGIWERRNYGDQDCQPSGPDIIALWLKPDGSGSCYHGNPDLGYDTIDIGWSFSSNRLTIDFGEIGTYTYSVVFGTYNDGKDRNMDLTPMGVENACTCSLGDIDEWVW